MDVINHRYNSINFSANLLVSDKNNLLDSSQIKVLTDMVKPIGEEDDIIEFNLGSDIIDWAEVNDKQRPKKFLSGYKMSVETTVDGIKNTDLSVADTQQNFWERYSELAPFEVLKDWINSIKDNADFDNKKNNLNPDIYNSSNNNWDNRASIETPDEVINDISARPNFFNSPFFRAFTDMPDTSLAAVFNDNLSKGSHRINIQQLRMDIERLKSGQDIKAPVLDFESGIVYPQTEEVKSTPFIFVDGLQTQFPEIEGLADVIIRMEVPEEERTASFIKRASQMGVSEEQSRKDLNASNKYMKELIPLNPDTPDVVINGRYDKDDLFELLRTMFGQR